MQTLGIHIMMVGLSPCQAGAIGPMPMIHGTTIAGGIAHVGTIHGAGTTRGGEASIGAGDIRHTGDGIVPIMEAGPVIGADAISMMAGLQVSDTPQAEDDLSAMMSLAYVQDPPEVLSVKEDLDAAM